MWYLNHLKHLSKRLNLTVWSLGQRCSTFLKASFSAPLINSRRNSNFSTICRFVYEGDLHQFIPLHNLIKVPQYFTSKLNFFFRRKQKIQRLNHSPSENKRTIQGEFWILSIKSSSNARTKRYQKSHFFLKSFLVEWTIYKDAPQS